MTTTEALDPATRDVSDDPTYRQRPRPFGPEVTWRLEPEHLFADSGLRNKRVPYGRIAAIRLTYAPTNFTSHAFKAAIRLDDGKTLTFGSLSWKTYFEAERQDAGYRAFVAELVRRTEAANPGVALVAGKTQTVWLAAAVVGIATATALMGAIVWAVGRGDWMLAGLSALFGIPFVWQVWGMTTRNRPGVFRAGSIPETVLPRG